MNYRAPLQATRLAMPHMGIKHNRGAIIYFSSTLVTQLGMPGFGSYCGAKVRKVHISDWSKNTDLLTFYSRPGSMGLQNVFSKKSEVAE